MRHRCGSLSIHYRIHFLKVRANRRAWRASSFQLITDCKMAASQGILQGSVKLIITGGQVEELSRLREQVKKPGFTVVKGWGKVVITFKVLKPNSSTTIN